MERDIKPPSHEAPKPTPTTPPEPERGGFFERWRKKEKAAETAEKPKKKAESAEASKGAAEQPQTRRQKFGAHVLGFLFGKEKARPEQPLRPEQPAAERPQTAEEQPVYERATRMRRFARTIINKVLGEAQAEPVRARERNGRAANPLDTEPLIDAAADLQGAAEGLGSKLREARMGSVGFETSVIPTPAVAETGGYDAGGFETPAIVPTPELMRSFDTISASERIAQRLAQLEAEAETSKATSAVALGLGVIAVLVAGHEYFARKRVERSHNKTKKEVREQKETIAEQEAAFQQLRQERAGTMDRSQRQAYYERLSEFTHTQADTTREVTRELQQALPVPERAATPTPATPQPVRVFNPETRRFEEHPDWQPTATVERAPTRSERKPAPLVTVETADTIERNPSLSRQQGGSPPLGGGTIGSAGAGTVPIDDQLASQNAKAPLSPAALRQEAVRKARAARLASNAWMYGIALVLALGVAAITFIVLG